MPVLSLLLAYRRYVKLCSFEAYPRADNAVSSMAYKGGISLALLWLTKKATSSGSPAVLALLRLTQEVPVTIPTPLTQEVPLAVEHISPQVCIFVLQLQIHLGKQKNNLVENYSAHENR
jgi:hypothetical protein